MPPLNCPKPNVMPDAVAVADCDNVKAVPAIADTNVLAGIPEPYTICPTVMFGFEAVNVTDVEAFVVDPIDVVPEAAVPPI